MLKDDIKDQIPLFDLTVPTNTVSPTDVDGTQQKTAVSEKPAPAGKAKLKKIPASSITVPKTGKISAKPSPGRRAAAKGSPGPVPEGDVRLTANIREDLHLKLKIVAATRRTTIGELIEELVEHHL